MAENKPSFALETLKSDPLMWKRLATPIGRRKDLGNVFPDKENPFTKDGVAAAMQKIQELAAQGKLYLREEGRSRHFRKLELDGNKLKPTETFEASVENNGNMIYSGLMRASRAYFKWLGLDRISGWFDKRVQKYDTQWDREHEYKEEIKSMTSKQKSDLKKLRKKEKQEEKARRKLENLEKETAKARKELEEILGKGDKKDDLVTNTPQQTAPQQTAPQQTAPQQTAPQQTAPQQTAPQQTAPQPIEAKPEDPHPDLRLTFGGQEYTKENIAQAPENVKRAFELIEALAAEMSKMKQPENEQPIAQQPVAEQPVVPQNKQVQQNYDIIQGEQFEILPEQKEIKNEDTPTAVEQTENQPVVPGHEQQELDQNNIPANEPQTNNEQPEFEIEVNPNLAENAPTMDQDLPNAQTNAPLTNPYDLERDKVSAHGRAPEGETLQERLASEKRSMDLAMNWKERIVNALFSHKEAADFREIYEALGDAKESADYLTTGTLGAMARFEEEPQLIDKLLNGESLGAEHDEAIREGVGFGAQVRLECAEGNGGRLENVIAHCVRQLSELAGKETSLSPRHVMIGRMISNAMSMATENGLTLPLNERELAMAQGAVTLSQVAKDYYSARQYLGNGKLDTTSEKGVASVRDLLMGNAVNTMIKQDQLDDGEKTTQILMGKGVWSVDKLAQMTNNSKVRKAIQPHQVEKILNEPGRSMAHKAANSVINEVITQTYAIQQGQQQTRSIANERDIANPAINALNA